MAWHGVRETNFPIKSATNCAKPGSNVVSVSEKPGLEPYTHTYIDVVKN